MNEVRPIFLISLPRSGSTLLQKILTVSPEIHSVSETWLMLPLAFMLRPEETLATYNHTTAFNAIEDFIKTLPNEQKDFYAALNCFAISLYGKTRPNVRYFIDKTPRYYLIIQFLAEVFPDAKFIFLFRHPLEILSSILTTWMNDRLIIGQHYVDIFHGPHALSDGYNLLKDRAIAVNYADLVTSPRVMVRRICSYLQIEYDPSMVANYNNVRLTGRMGDQQGIQKLESVSASSLGKWKSVLNTRYRKWFSKRYIRYLRDETLATFGTSVNGLTQEIDSISTLRRGSLKDLFYHLVSIMCRWGNAHHYKKLFTSFVRRERFYPYI